MQDAVLELKGDKQLELYARLLHINRRLRKAPEDIESVALHTAAPRSKVPPKGVKLPDLLAKPKVGLCPRYFIEIGSYTKQPQRRLCIGYGVKRCVLELFLGGGSSTVWLHCEEGCDNLHPGSHCSL